VLVLMVDGRDVISIVCELWISSYICCGYVKNVLFKLGVYS